ncbi:MAG: glutamate racemase [Bacteroidota bacterium]
MQAYWPIGIFDSGVGGLAVARAIKNLLPYERLYYVGDTAHLPYGEQTTVQLQTYSQAIGSLLLRQNCKVIVIACNTATAAVTDALQDYVGPHVPVLNVVDPVVCYVKQHYTGKTVGLIGTNYTIQSNLYAQKFYALQAGIHLKALATPQLVPMIEARSFPKKVLKGYLTHPQLTGIQALILGCTHYWLIKKQIAHCYKNKIEIIDGADLLAASLKTLLISRQLINPGNPIHRDQFVATKLTPGFQEATKHLFGQEVHLIT